MIEPNSFQIVDGHSLKVAQIEIRSPDLVMLVILYSVLASYYFSSVDMGVGMFGFPAFVSR